MFPFLPMNMMIIIIIKDIIFLYAARRNSIVSTWNSHCRTYPAFRSAFEDCINPDVERDLFKRIFEPQIYIFI